MACFDSAHEVGSWDSITGGRAVAEGSASRYTSRILPMTQAGAPGRAGWNWPFSFSDLTAGLRKHFGDATLAVDDVQPTTLPFQKPAIGAGRAMLKALIEGKATPSEMADLAQKLGSTRIGL